MRKIFMKLFLVAFFVATLGFLTVLVSATTEASNRLVPKVEKKCELQDKATITIKFRGETDSASSIETLQKEKMSMVQKAANALGSTKLEVQSRSYSVNSSKNRNRNSDNKEFSYNGNSSLLLEPANIGLKLVEALSKQGINASLNVNSHRRCK